MKRYQPTNPDRPVAVGYEANDVIVTLANGEVLRTPLSLHPWLAEATQVQRAHMEFDASAVYFPDMDDGLDRHRVDTSVRHDRWRSKLTVPFLLRFLRFSPHAPALSH